MNAKNTLITAFSILSLTVSICAGQQIKEIRVGEKLPEVFLKNVINHSSQATALKNLHNNQVLIIDFWATWCVPCIREMRFLDSLRGKNPDKFNVLMVTSQPKEVVDAFLAKEKDTYLHLPIYFQDTLLRQYFPHRAIPHNIWINKSGVVKAITGNTEVTEANIFRFSQTSELSLPTKKDIMDFRKEQEFHHSDKNFLYRSMITPLIPTNTSGAFGGAFRGKSTTRYFEFNSTILDFFWSAFSKFSPTPQGDVKNPKLIELHTKDSLRFMYSDKLNAKTNLKYANQQEWNEKNMYCFALTLPHEVVDTIFRRYLFSDLERQFSVKATIEKRKRFCYEIRGSRKVRKSLVQAENNKLSVQWLTSSKIVFKGATIREILDHFYRRFTTRKGLEPFVLLNNTGIEKWYDVELDFGNLLTTSQPSITVDMFFKKLGEYGFYTRKKLRPYPILVLRDQLD